MKSIFEGIEIIKKYEKDWEYDEEFDRVWVGEVDGKAACKMKTKDRERMKELGWFMSMKRGQWCHMIEDEGELANERRKSQVQD